MLWMCLVALSVFTAAVEQLEAASKAEELLSVDAGVQHSNENARFVRQFGFGPGPFGGFGGPFGGFGGPFGGGGGFGGRRFGGFGGRRHFGGGGGFGGRRFGGFGGRRFIRRRGFFG